MRYTQDPRIVHLRGICPQFLTAWQSFGRLSNENPGQDRQGFPQCELGTLIRQGSAEAQTIGTTQPQAHQTPLMC